MNLKRDDLVLVDGEYPAKPIYDYNEEYKFIEYQEGNDNSGVMFWVGDRDNGAYYTPDRLEKVEESVEFAKGGKTNNYQTINIHNSALNTALAELRNNNKTLTMFSDTDVWQFVPTKDYRTINVIKNGKFYTFGGYAAMVNTIKEHKLYLKENYAKGGKVFSRDEINENDLDTIFVEGTRYDGDMFSENQETTDIDYVIDNWKDNRNVATYKISLSPIL